MVVVLMMMQMMMILVLVIVICYMYWYCHHLQISSTRVLSASLLQQASLGLGKISLAELVTRIVNQEQISSSSSSSSRPPPSLSQCRPRGQTNRSELLPIAPRSLRFGVGMGCHPNLRPCGAEAGNTVFVNPGSPMVERIWGSFGTSDSLETGFHAIGVFRCQKRALTGEHDAQ